MTARSCLKELQQISGHLNRDTVPTRPRWREHDISQVTFWNRWISWERKDPLGFTSEDGKGGMPGGKAQVIERVIYAYKQALQPLRYYPQMWFDLAEYCASLDMSDDQMKFLREGVAANVGSCLLNFRLAEVYEIVKKRDDAKSTYQTLSASILKEINNVETLGEERVNILKKSISSETGDDAKKAAAPDNENFDGDDSTSIVSRRDRGTLNRIKKTEERNKKHVAELSKDLTLCSTMFMRATKRMEGLKAARQVFSDARKSPYATHHIFVASALMEYHHNNSPEIASKIFELGLRKFADSAAFVEQYLDFLLVTNDDTNARALFERTVSRLSPQDAEPLFKKFYAYEAAYGSELSIVSKLESRMLELYPSTSPIARFAGRYTLGGHCVIDKQEVGPLVYKEITQDEQGRLGVNESNQEISDDEDFFQNQILLAAKSDVGASTSKKRHSRKRTRDELKDESRKRSRKREAQELVTSSLYPDASSSVRSEVDRNGGFSSSQPSGVLTDGILRLLSALPPAATYNAVSFDVDGVMRLIGNTAIPSVPPPTADLSRFRRS